MLCRIEVLSGDRARAKIYAYGIFGRHNLFSHLQILYLLALSAGLILLPIRGGVANGYVRRWNSSTSIEFPTDSRWQKLL
jgi:hypothetical protein